jgi:hypothetical protein
MEKDSVIEKKNDSLKKREKEICLLLEEKKRFTKKNGKINT